MITLLAIAISAGYLYACCHITHLLVSARRAQQRQQPNARHEDTP